MKVIITGITSQLGWALKRTKPKEIEIIPCNRNLVDLKEEKIIIKFIEENNPDWVINCAAYTNIDKAEKEKDLSKISGTPVTPSHIFNDSFRPKKFVKDFFNKVINKLYKKNDYVPKLPKLISCRMVSNYLNANIFFH